MSAAPANANARGSSHKTCATKGCNWIVEVWQKSKLCVVCEQKKHFAGERARLHTALQSRRVEGPVRRCIRHTKGHANCGEIAQSVERVHIPRCTFCTHPVVLVHPTVPSKHVVCMGCIRKSRPIEAVAPAKHSSGSSETLHPSNAAPHLAVEHTVTPPIETTSVRPIVIVPDPPSVCSAHDGSFAPESSSAAARTTANNLQIPASPSHDVTLQPLPSKQTPSTVPTADPSHTQPAEISTSFPHSPLPEQLNVLFNQWCRTEKSMATLAGAPHFNGKGEHIFPLLSARSVALRNSKVSSIVYAYEEGF